jgi:hypothetical protein
MLQALAAPRAHAPLPALASPPHNAAGACTTRTLLVRARAHMSHCCQTSLAFFRRP